MKLPKTKGEDAMSEYEEDKFYDDLDRWTTKKDRQKFIAKMERKLNRKEHFGN
jgi:hypothetical protein